jgi:hypothetical protein
MGLTKPTAAQIDSSTEVITDPISLLNNKSNRANVDVGFLFNRDGGISSNVAVFWQESSQQFVFALTSSNAVSRFSNIAVTSNANVVTGGITSTGFINTSANISAGGNITVGNIIVPTGAGQFSGPFNESTTVQGVYIGNLNLSPRIGFFNGTAAQNWQIDNNFGTFRWFTPGVVRMSLDARGNLSVFNFANINITSGSADSALQIVGNVSRGGAGFHDFLRVTTTASGATNVNKHFRLDGTGNLSIINSAYNSTILSLTDSGILSDGKGDVRSATQNSQSGAYVLVATDSGKHISITTGGVTVNANIFSIGDMVTVYNNSGSSQNITQGTSVTLRLAGTATTGTRALAQYGVATLLCVTGGASPVFACTGAGLT